MDQDGQASTRLGRRRLTGPAVVAVAMVVTLALAGGCASEGRQEVRSGGDQVAVPTSAVPSTFSVTTVVGAPPVFDEARARYEVVRAPAGKAVGRAPAIVVDDVALRTTVRAKVRSGTRSVSSARRIRISAGPFPYGDARVLVLVDGRSVGEGQVGDNGRTLTAAVFDPAVVHGGSVIGYQIEPRPPVTVGAVRIGG